MNQQIKRFRSKIYFEVLIKCSLYALSIGLFVASILLILVKKSVLKWNYLTCVWIGIGLFALSFLILFMIFRPTEKKIAARLDKDLQLNEKVKTMVYYKDSNQPMMVVQREETNKILEKFSPKQIPLRIAMLGFIMLLLSGGSLTYSVFASKKPARLPEKPPITSTTDVPGIVDEIINQVEFSRVDEVIKNKLLDILYEVLYAIQSEELSNDEKLEVVVQAIDKVYDILDQDISGIHIGEALKKNPTTKDLGISIIDVDQKKLKQALKVINDELQFLTGKGLDNLLDEYSKVLNEALALSNAKEDDELCAVISKWSKTFHQYSKISNKENIKEKIQTAIDTAEVDIWAALMHQDIAIEMCKEVLDILNQIKDVLENPDQQPSQPNESVSGDLSNETSGNESSSNSAQGSENSTTDSSSGSEDQPSHSGSEDEYQGIQYADTETLFDPNSNTNIEYGKLIDEYYNYIISRIKDGTLDPSVEEIINQYFSMLYNNNQEESDSEQE